MLISQSIRILCVEDDPGAARLLQKRLQRAGYAVDIATNGENGLAVWDAEKYDLLTVDQDMPKVSGLEVIRTLASRDALPPTVMVTGAGNEKIAVEAMGLGAEDYIIKDGEGRYLDLVLTVIERAVKKARLTREKVRAEEALQESEERFRSFFDGSAAGMAVLDKDMRFVAVNETLADFGGYSVEAHIGKRIDEIVPYLADQLEKLFRRIFDDGEPVVNIEINGETAQAPGSLRHWVGSYFPIFGRIGAPSAIGAVVIEVTAKKRAEEALRASEDLFRRTFHQAPIGAAIIDLQGYFQRVNPEFSNITGYSEEELISRHYLEITHPDHVLADEEQAERLRRGDIDHHQAEKRYIRKDGRVVWARTSVRIVSDGSGKPRFFLPMVVDVTSNKLMEEALRESEEAYRLTLSHISDAVFMTDDSGRLTFVCPNVNAIFGYGEDEVLRMGSISALLGNSLFDPAELEDQNELSNIERTITDKAGEAHALLVNVKQVAIKAGTVLYTCRDITDRKRAEEALLLANEELERRIEAGTQQLREFNERLGLEIAERKGVERASERE